MSNKNHPCANKCSRYKNEPCNTCLVSDEPTFIQRYYQNTIKKPCLPTRLELEQAEEISALKTDCKCLVFLLVVTAIVAVAGWLV